MAISTRLRRRRPPAGLILIVALFALHGATGCGMSPERNRNGSSPAAPVPAPDRDSPEPDAPEPDAPAGLGARAPGAAVAGRGALRAADQAGPLSRQARGDGRPAGRPTPPRSLPQSLIYSGLAGIAIAGAGLGLVGWRRRLW